MELNLDDVRAAIGQIEGELIAARQAPVTPENDAAAKQRRIRALEDEQAALWQQRRVLEARARCPLPAEPAPRLAIPRYKRSQIARAYAQQPTDEMVTWLALTNNASESDVRAVIADAAAPRAPRRLPTTEGDAA